MGLSKRLLQLNWTHMREIWGTVVIEDSGGSNEGYAETSRYTPCVYLVHNI